MIDFAALPPEVNSARMYAGVGATPLLDAAAAWDNLATELASSAAEYSSQVTGLAAVWIGPSATAMATAAMRYTAWLTTTAEMAQSTGMQAQAAAAAYQSAFSATVPPMSVIANRTQLVTLTVTNFLGVNTAAIAANEAMYAEFWAQDAAAMTAYAAASQAATAALPQFTPAPQTATGTTPQTTPQTTPASTQTLLQWLLAQISNPTTWLGQLNTYAQSFVSSGPYMIPTSLLQLFTVLWGVSSPNSALGQAITNRITNGGAMILPEIRTTPGTTPGTTSAIRAGIADGERLGGRLSVPPSWAQQREPSQQDRGPVATPLDHAESSGLAGIAGMGGLGGLAGMRGTPQKQQQPKYGVIPRVMPQTPYGG